MKLAILAPIILACAAACAADWPQVGGNPQHTNSSPDSPAPPYRVAWVADFSPELIYSAQPVIAAGRLFQTTLNGSLYALDVATGKRLWHFRAGTCTWGSAGAETPADGGAGRVFVATWDGLVYGLDAATGKQLWQYDAEEPISGSPCVADGMIFLGTRKGNLLAIGTDGTKRWKQPLSWHVYSTAAWDAGKVFVVTEDMFVHCVDAKTGRPVWKSQKLHGLLFREFYPVVQRPGLRVGHAVRVAKRGRRGSLRGQSGQGPDGQVQHAAGYEAGRRRGPAEIAGPRQEVPAGTGGGATEAHPVLRGKSPLADLLRLGRRRRQATVQGCAPVWLGGASASDHALGRLSGRDAGCLLHHGRGAAGTVRSRS
jgi:hypothetical protein